VLWDIVRNLTQMVPAEDLFLICNDCIFKFVGKLMQKNVRAERGGGKVAKSKVKIRSSSSTPRNVEGWWTFENPLRRCQTWCDYGIG
jgi:hypothetical protein